MMLGTLATARGVRPCTAAAATSPPAGLKASKTRPGDSDLKAALGTAALSWLGYNITLYPSRRIRLGSPVATSTCTGSGSMSDDPGIRPYSEGSFGPASAIRGFLVWDSGRRSGSDPTG